MLYRERPGNTVALHSERPTDYPATEHWIVPGTLRHDRRLRESSGVVRETDETCATSAREEAKASRHGRKHTRKVIRIAVAEALVLHQ